MLVSCGQVHHGQSAWRTRATPRRRSGSRDPEQRLLDGKIRNESARVEAGDGEIASPPYVRITRGRRPSRGKRKLFGSRSVLPKVDRIRPKIGRASKGLGIP